MGFWAAVNHHSVGASSVFY